MLIVATCSGVAWGAYQQAEWGDLAMTSGAMLFGVLVALAGFRTRIAAEVEEKRLQVMLEELRAPRRSQPSVPRHSDPGSHG